MAIQFLPTEYVVPQFQAMEESHPPATIARLLSYYRSQWIENPRFPISSWSVFNRAIRTNNDVEGWHHRINNMAIHQSSLNIYRLVHLLHTESANVKLQVTFLSNGAVLRYQRVKYRRVQAIITKAWSDLNEGHISAKKLLKRCAQVNGPAVQNIDQQ